MCCPFARRPGWLLRKATRHGESATVIVMRRASKVWLVFNGALKTTVAMSDPECEELVVALRAASR